MTGDLRTGQPSFGTGVRARRGVALRFPRRTAFGVLWAVSLVVAGGLGWSLGRIDSTADRPAGFVSARVLPDAWPPPEPSRPTQPTATPDPAADPESSNPPAEPEAPVEPPEVAAALPALPEPAREPAPAPATPAPRTGPTAPNPRPETPAPTPAPAAPAGPDEVAAPEEIPAEIEPVAPAPDYLGRARDIDRLADDGSPEEAGRQAAALLAELGSYSALEAALADAGVGGTVAQLTALRVVQLAGHEAAARDLARALKLSNSGSTEVLDAIRSWRILTPRITSLDPSIEEDGRAVAVRGTIENPDVVDVRRVRIEVDALDASGNVLDTIEARVAERRLGPGDACEFVASFRKLDPASVIRTRASVVAWESEVLNAR